jgi:magnesium transporter
MLKIYKTENEELVEKDSFQKNCWINISNPSKEEIDTIIEKFNIPIEFILDALDMDERPRVDIEDGKLFVVLRMPIKNLENPFDTVSFGVLLFKDYTVTIYKKNEFDVISELFNKKLNKVNIETKDNTNLLLKIFHKTSLLYLKYLKEIRQETELLEKEFKHNTSNKILSNLLRLEKSLIYFKTGLNSNEAVMNKFKKFKAIQDSEDYKDTLEDVLIENNQAIETTNIYNKVLDDLKNYFFSVISNNLNNRMKNLTIITVALMLPTLITSFYGMNLKLPFMDKQFTSIIIFIISIALSLLTVITFYLKRE